MKAPQHELWLRDSQKICLCLFFNQEKTVFLCIIFRWGKLLQFQERLQTRIKRNNFLQGLPLKILRRAGHHTQVLDLYQHFPN